MTLSNHPHRLGRPVGGEHRDPASLDIGHVVMTRVLTDSEREQAGAVPPAGSHGQESAVDDGDPNRRYRA